MINSFEKVWPKPSFTTVVVLLLAAFCVSAFMVGNYLIEGKQQSDRYGELSPTPVTLEGYKEVLSEGDNIAAIHITNGEPFHIDIVRESFRMMDEVIAKYYSDLNIKAYHGYSWVFNKHLRDIMGRDTNLTLLADMFDLYPTAGGHHGIYEYVFKRPESTPTEELPEDSSMQRAIKKYLLDGNTFCEMAAVKMIK